MTIAQSRKTSGTHKRKLGLKSSSQNRQATSQPTTPAFQQALQHGELSPDEMIQLQGIIGNRAVQQLTHPANQRISLHTNGHDSPAEFLGVESEGTLVQRLPTKEAFDKKVKKDVKKHEKELSKAKKTEDKKASHTEKSENEAGGLFTDIANLVSGIVDSVVDSVQQGAYQNLLDALDKFEIEHQYYKAVTPTYSDLGDLLTRIKDVEKASAALLLMLKNDDPRTKHVEKLQKQAEALFIKQSPNAERAKAAQKQLKNKQKDNPERITDELIKLLVMAIAMPRNLKDDRGQAGVIGISQAIQAVEALVLLSESDYDKIMGLLAKSGDDWGEVAQQGTILKALAARKSDLVEAGPQTEKALQKIEKFADDIREMNRDDMINATNAADRGTGTGLKQRFTMSCGPTSIQIVKADIDPIYALTLTQEAGGLKSSKYKGTAGKEQKKLLEKTAGKTDVAIPRVVQADWTAFTTAATNHVNGIADNAQKLKAQKEIGAVALYLQKKPYNASDYSKGVTRIKGLGTGIDFDKRLPEFRKLYAVLTGNAPGTMWVKFSKLLTDSNEGDTQQKFDTIKTYKAGKTKLVGRIHKHLAKVDKALFNGGQVPFGVAWNGSGGHFMVLVDKKGKRSETSYLIAEPWVGQSYWITRKDLIDGKFTNAGLASDGTVIYIYV